MKTYLVTMRDDRGVGQRYINAVIESDEPLSRLDQHAHVAEVLGIVDVTLNEKERKAGYKVVSDEEAKALLGETKESTPVAEGVDEVDETNTGDSEKSKKAKK